MSLWYTSYLSSLLALLVFIVLYLLLFNSFSSLRILHWSKAKPNHNPINVLMAYKNFPPINNLSGNFWACGHSVFAYGFDFADIFVSVKSSAVSLIPQSKAWRCHWPRGVKQVFLNFSKFSDVEIQGFEDNSRRF